MFEHVGRARFAEYFRAAYDSPRTRADSSSITRIADRERTAVARPRRRTSRPLHLPRRRAGSRSRMHCEFAERAGFEVRDVESLREHYAKHAARMGSEPRAESRRRDRGRGRADLSLLAAVHGGQRAGLSCRPHRRVPGVVGAPGLRRPRLTSPRPAPNLYEREKDRFGSAVSVRDRRDGIALIEGGGGDHRGVVGAVFRRRNECRNALRSRPRAKRCL